MDERSHKLFASILLEKAGKSKTSPEWSIAPDIDMPFLHRWYRHRIRVLPRIYMEFPTAERLSGFRISDADLDAIALCVISHLYLDIFNGWVFPFGIWNPIYPKKTVINGVFEDIDRPRLLVKELRRLAGEGNYPEQFYSDSRKIMENLASSDTSAEEFIAQLVRRLASYADIRHSYSLYSSAMKQIGDFTGNSRYTETHIYPFLTDSVCNRFELEYADLINRGMEA